MNPSTNRSTRAVFAMLTVLAPMVVQCRCAQSCIGLRLSTARALGKSVVRSLRAVLRGHLPLERCLLP